MIYLDNAATTSLNEEVLKTLTKLYDNYFMNANSPYFPALKINELQETSRLNIAELLNVKSSELIFTSCGSESNNMAIKGIAFKYLNKGKKHIITSMIEHSSVYETMRQLESFGFEITYLLPDNNGKISNVDIINSIKDNTILVSIMKINSEIGAINNIETIYDEIKAINNNIVVHCDCVQAFGKYDLDLSKFDLASFSAHKINGLKGSGLLYKKDNISLLPLLSGGEQEFQLRAGTSNYHYNIVLAKTLRLYLEQRNNDIMKDKYEYIYNLLLSDKRIHLNSKLKNNSYYIINFSIPEYKAEVILNALEKEDIYIATKSACSTNVKRSRVMDAMPINEMYKDSSFRISFSLDTTKEQFKDFYQILIDCLDYIKKG